MDETINRPGSKSSELWLVGLFFATVVLNGTTYINIPGEHIAMLATLTFGYGGGRTLLKNQLIKKVNGP